MSIEIQDSVQSESLSARIARALILAARKTPFGGVGGYSSDAFSATGDHRPFPQADIERSQYRDFFNLFPSGSLDAALPDATVLDFGCGYGGKTVEYRRASGSAKVYGIEPFEAPVRLGQAYAESIGEPNVEFKLCAHTEIPLPDNSIDTVVSHDVLEHVQNPMISIAEIRRVLKPGGQAFLVFPLYWGACSHHLDYVTRLPGLHWLFRANSLIDAVNPILASDPRIGVSQQPKPGLSFDGAHYVLPMLNGLSGRHLFELTRGFEVVYEKRQALMGRRKGIGMLTTALVSPPVPHAWRDLITSTMAFVLKKPSQIR